MKPQKEAAASSFAFIDLKTKNIISSQLGVGDSDACGHSSRKRPQSHSIQLQTDMLSCQSLSLHVLLLSTKVPRLVISVSVFRLLSTILRVVETKAQQLASSKSVQQRPPSAHRNDQAPTLLQHTDTHPFRSVNCSILILFHPSDRCNNR
jgi:hypothetical protein